VTSSAVIGDSISRAARALGAIGDLSPSPCAAGLGYARPMARARPRSSRSRRAREELDLVKMAVLAKRSGVPTPTIKHYIREGLLPGPHVRTSKNMAYYDGRIVDRIKAIKALQAEQYLPLRVIGELMEPAPSAALRADPRNQRRALGALAPIVAADRKLQRRRRADVLKTESVSKAELAQLEKAGVLELRGEGETAGYSGPDRDIVELIGELRRLGYGDLFPIEIGAVYLEAVQRLIAVEIAQFTKHALGRALPGPLPEVARQAIAFGERLVIALRAKLIPAMLSSLGSGDHD